MCSKFDVVKQYLCRNSLPTYQELFKITKDATDVLDKEETFYREKSDDDMPGSLLDFQFYSLPLIVIPDLHARPYFLLNILNYVLPQDFIPKYQKYADEKGNLTVFNALENNLIRCICVGDALHTEYCTRERWEKAYEGYLNNQFTNPQMCAEMTEGLSLICGLMKLKEFFPENFHFLKGNHENITNRSENGDFAFVKYVDEGQMVMEFVTSYYGEDILYLLSYVEKSLPLIAVTDNIVISHAEPMYAFSRYQLINAHLYADVVAALTWTDNNQADDGSVLGIIKALSENQQNSAEKYRYIGGHRPVKGLFKTRQNGLFVQIHNPAMQNIALVYQDKVFDPVTCIVNVKNNE